MLASDKGSFAVVTGGVRWKPMLQRLAQSLGYGAQLKHIEIVEQDGARLLADRDLALKVLSQACERAADSGAHSIVLGGAGLAGYASQLQAHSPLPLIDSVSAGLEVFLSGRMPASQTVMNRFHTDWNHLPAHMGKLI